MTRTTTSSSPARSDSSDHDGRDGFVVGVDAGGTTTRALVTTLSGERVGEARAEGCNPNAHGARTAAERLSEAVGLALDQADARARRSVAAAVVGLAGVSSLREKDVRDRMVRALIDAGLPAGCGVFTGDDEVAFASGTPAADGTVLIAGTGAIATRIEGRERARSADGMGWLIGDEGSGVWMGHQAARETARQLSRGGELSPLARAVSERVLSGPGSAHGRGRPPEEHARDFARALTAAAPVALAELAPLVSQAHELGDPAAGVIVEAAAGHLARSVHQVRSPGERLPVVLVGGVLAGSEPVRAALTRKLALGAARSTITMAGCTAGGAAWLAALRTGVHEQDHRLHSAFTRPEQDRPDAA